MAKFFVGQRVRVVRPGNPAHLGLTGRITRFFEREVPTITYSVNCDVSWDQEIAIGHTTATHTDRLEPITPDGHRASEFSFTELMDRCREGVSA